MSTRPQMPTAQRELWNRGPSVWGLAEKAGLAWYTTDLRAARIDGLLIERPTPGPQSADFSDELKELLGDALPATGAAGVGVPEDEAPKAVVTRGPKGRSVGALKNDGKAVEFDDLAAGIEYFNAHFPLNAKSPLDMPNGHTIQPPSGTAGLEPTGE